MAYFEHLPVFADSTVHAYRILDYIIILYNQNASMHVIFHMTQASSHYENITLRPIPEYNNRL